MTEFYNIRSVNNVSKSELTSAFQRVLESGWYILGNEVKRFESEFANFCEVKNCVGVGNCLDALQFILHCKYFCIAIFFALQLFLLCNYVDLDSLSLSLGS